MLARGLATEHTEALNVGRGRLGKGSLSLLMTRWIDPWPERLTAYWENQIRKESGLKMRGMKRSMKLRRHGCLF